MKISFLVYNIYGMGGTVRTVVNQANYLASKNHNVEIISVRKISKEPLFNIDSRVKLTPLYDARRGKGFYKGMPFHKKILKKILLRVPSLYIDKSEDLYHMFNLFVDLKIVNKLKKLKSDVLITTIPSFNVLASKYAPKKVVRIGQEHKYFQGHDIKLQKKIKASYKNLDALSCLTDSEVDDYSKILQNSNVQVYKIENSTEILDETASLDKKVVLAAGRYVPQKGFDLLVPAFSKVIKKHPDWRLKIFGSGSGEQMLREKIFEEKAYNNIFLVPTSKDILGEMLNSSMYVMSSRYEPFGMVIIEAMSVGVPCVSFSCTGPKEIIKHGEDGLLVDEGDIDQLADSINELIESEEKRKSFGAAAKKNVNRYSYEVVGEKWEKIMIEQLNKKKLNKGTENLLYEAKQNEVQQISDEAQTKRVI
ncbi:glycosyltransferase family 4 protein [Alkalicoccobacillus gibsonii]|uniref:glycosyltransferase family 4 protein n=1 Tax=Alkalicoccobacillus gibsonii TaxID=79881 RepID=UPI003F7C0656